MGPELKSEAAATAANHLFTAAPLNGQCRQGNVSRRPRPIAGLFQLARQVRDDLDNIKVNRVSVNVEHGQALRGWELTRGGRAMGGREGPFVALAFG
jgi:hypothetical protein